MTETAESILDRALPHSDEAEAAVLGSIVRGGLEAFGEIAAEIGLKAEMFHRTKHQIIFEALQDLWNENQSADLLLLKEQIERMGALENVGGATYLAEVAICVPSAANGIHYANIVRERFMRRSGAALGTKVLRGVYDETKPVDQTLDRAEEEFFKLREESETHGPVTTAEALAEGLAKLDQKGKQEVTGIPSGIIELDKMTCGFQKGELSIIASRPSQGKSSFVISMINKLPPETRVLFFSLEMRKEQIATNMMINRARIESNRFRKGYMDEADRERAKEAARKIAAAPVWIDDDPGLGIGDLRARARRWRRQEKIDIIFVDYIQLMRVSVKAENRQLGVAEISAGLKRLARELEIPVIALSQVSRSREDSATRPPTLDRLRDSGTLEQDGDLIALIHRPEYYQPMKIEYKNLAQIIIAKQRNGPTGIIECSFLGPFFAFTNDVPNG